MATRPLTKRRTTTANGHRCPTCGNNFATPRALTVHTGRAHPAPVGADPEAELEPLRAAVVSLTIERDTASAQADEARAEAARAVSATGQNRELAARLAVVTVERDEARAGLARIADEWTASQSAARPPRRLQRCTACGLCVNPKRGERCTACVADDKPPADAATWAHWTERHRPRGPQRAGQ